MARSLCLKPVSMEADICIHYDVSLYQCIEMIYYDLP